MSPIESAKREGAADMKRRILEVLPEEVEVGKGNYINLRETVAETIKSIQSQDQGPKECICDQFPIGSRMVSAVWYCPVHGSMEKKWI